MQQVLQQLGVRLAHPCWVQRKKRCHNNWQTPTHALHIQQYISL